MLARYDMTCVPILRRPGDSSGPAADPASTAGEILLVHSALRCPALAGEGTWCCIHRPSDHHMRTWQMVWVDEHHFMIRLCEHGNGHIDPDDAEHRNRMWARERLRHAHLSDSGNTFSIIADQFDAGRHACGCLCCDPGARP